MSVCTHHIRRSALYQAPIVWCHRQYDVTACIIAWWEIMQATVEQPRDYVSLDKPPSVKDHVFFKPDSCHRSGGRYVFWRTDPLAYLLIMRARNGRTLWCHSHISRFLYFYAILLFLVELGSVKWWGNLTKQISSATLSKSWPPLSSVFCFWKRWSRWV